MGCGSGNSLVQADRQGICLEYEESIQKPMGREKNRRFQVAGLVIRKRSQSRR